MSLFNDYGFDLTASFDEKSVERFKVNYESVLKKRQARWSQLIINDQLPVFDGKMKRFVRKGIPAQYRPQVWFEYSGAVNNYLENVGAYNNWFKEELTGPNLTVIEADLPRSFPENERFLDPDHPRSLLPHLRRILTAFVNRNPQFGYCQGMNFIGGLILLVMEEDEEKAFWVFDTLVTKILKSYYMTNMIRVQVDCMVFEELLRIKLPSVYDSIVNKCGASCILICAKWFLCSFVDVLPIQTVLRVLDCVFCEGDKILFRAALAIVRLNSSSIANCSNIAQIMGIFKDIYQTDSVLFCHEFANCMFSMIGSLSQRTVDNLRNEAEQKLKSK